MPEKHELPGALPGHILFIRDNVQGQGETKEILVTKSTIWESADQFTFTGEEYFVSDKNYNSWRVAEELCLKRRVELKGGGIRDSITCQIDGLGDAKPAKSPDGSENSDNPGILGAPISGLLSVLTNSMMGMLYVISLSSYGMSRLDLALAGGVIFSFTSVSTDIKILLERKFPLLKSLRERFELASGLPVDHMLREAYFLGCVLLRQDIFSLLRNFLYLSTKKPFELCYKWYRDLINLSPAMLVYNFLTNVARQGELVFNLEDKQRYEELRLFLEEAHEEERQLRTHALRSNQQYLQLSKRNRLNHWLRKWIDDYLIPYLEKPFSDPATVKAVYWQLLSCQDEVDKEAMMYRMLNAEAPDSVTKCHLTRMFENLQIVGMGFQQEMQYKYGVSAEQKRDNLKKIIECLCQYKDWLSSDELSDLSSEKKFEYTKALQFASLLCEAQIQFITGTAETRELIYESCDYFHKLYQEVLEWYTQLDNKSRNLEDIGRLWKKTDEYSRKLSTYLRESREHAIPIYLKESIEMYLDKYFKYHAILIQHLRDHKELSNNIGIQKYIAHYESVKKLYDYDLIKLHDCNLPPLFTLLLEQFCHDYCIPAIEAYEKNCSGSGFNYETMILELCEQDPERLKITPHQFFGKYGERLLGLPFRLLAEILQELHPTWVEQRRQAATALLEKSCHRVIENPLIRKSVAGAVFGVISCYKIIKDTLKEANDCYKSVKESIVKVAPFGVAVGVSVYLIWTNNRHQPQNMELKDLASDSLPSNFSSCVSLGL